MKMKEYLSQAFHIDRRINSKLEQVRSLYELAKKTTMIYTDMPGSPNTNGDHMENTIVKIVALKEEIDRDIDALVDMKTDIAHMIKSLEDHECQIVLEERYLSYMSMEQIAVGLSFSIQHTYRIHDKAVVALEKKYKR